MISWVEQDLDALSVLWERQWPAPPCVSLRHAYPERWVRFHSLPGSKEYPESEDEYAIVLERQRVLLEELGPDDDLLWVITTEWDGRPEPGPRMTELQRVDPHARHWESRLSDDDDPDDLVYEHVHVSSRSRSGNSLYPLLRLVADNAGIAVTLAPPDLRWVFRPYPGGVDVCAPSTAGRDSLKAAHPDWLSAHPSGL
ncbi:DUF3885 domain-containing protein [Streptomyces xanthophaeus]|uniref:DUF3885 domain-containing protein n=1 Tax=Streptomyces xanthophaeus TaxID=67385 RepID=UPI002649DE70|nr:hypothetical protein [Streptomyces xanthophaeus]WKD30611.1 hypothetical protein KO717_00550 [Streptomyces xanthophaeus]